VITLVVTYVLEILTTKINYIMTICYLVIAKGRTLGSLVAVFYTTTFLAARYLYLIGFLDSTESSCVRV
jgi:hypothetical protein